MAKAWLITRPPAIQGQHGDNRTYITAACVAYDHDLAEDEAFDAMREWNAACIPPWSEADLRQKIRSALRSATGGRGEKLRFHESVPRPSWVPLGDEGWHWLREDRELAATDEELAQEEGIDPTAEEFHTLQELQELAPTPEDLDTELDDGDTLDEPPPEEDIID
jgi:hypothetical protein